jgi:hypothetical protein
MGFMVIDGSIPSPDPTPTATPDPTPTDTPVTLNASGGDLAQWMDFLVHSQTWGNATITTTGALSTDADNVDVVSLSVDASQMQSDADDYIAFLEANPPAPCYSAVYNEALAAARNMSKSGMLMSRWADAAPYGSDADITSALALVKKASTQINAMDVALKAQSCLSGGTD